MYGRPPPPQPPSWQGNGSPHPPTGPRAGIGAAPTGPSNAGVGVGAPPARPPYSGPPPGFGPGGPPVPPGGYMGPPPSLPGGVAPPPGPPAAPASATGANSIQPTRPTDASTTVFVGSITPGISDDMLRQLLSTCGTLVTLKRISPAFGFASFDHPEAVMRAIDLLNGVELPTPANADPTKQKKLVVKADEKTKSHIEQYKVDRGDSRSDFENNLDSSGQAAINAFIETLKSPQALSLFRDSSSANATAVPAHLRDLPPEDLPEEHRKSVLGEIDKFRQASAAREEEKRRRERVLERERSYASGSSSSVAPPTGPRSAAAGGHDPQSFNHGAPGFVRESGSSSGAGSGGDAAPHPAQEDLDPEELDERAERKRKELKAKDEERRAQESLTAYTSRERNRLSHWSRVQEEAAADTQRSAKLAAQLVERSEKWDQDYEHSRELFWVDRPRWRHFRGPMLRRELEEDEADVRAEKEEAEKAAREAEKFLARQQEEMKRHIEEQRKKGVLVDGSSMAPLKLNRSADAAATAGTTGTTTAHDTPASAAPRVFGGDGDDDDDDPSALALRRRTLKVDLNEGMSEADRQAQLAAKRAEIQSQINSLAIKWEWIDATAIDTLYRPKIDALVEENVGERVPELVDVLVQAVREQQPRDRIKFLVEPVMAEDAETFTQQIVSILVEESNVAASGLVR